VPRRLRPPPLVELLADSQADGRPTLPFGIGCFSFDADPDRFDGSVVTYARELSDFLGAVQGLSMVSIRDAGAGWSESQLAYGLQDGGQPYPKVRGLRIDFRLTLTPEDQQQLGAWWSPSDEEVIDVSIRQGPDVPVAFVMPHGQPMRPTTLVTLTWRALRERAPADHLLSFHMRGPSPAHIDCVLLPERDDRAPRPRFRFERSLPGFGYALGIFGYREADFRTISDASEALFAQLELPAGVFYDARGAEDRLNDSWIELLEDRQHVVDLELSDGVRGWGRRRWQSPRVLRYLAVDLEEFESEVEVERGNCEARRQDLNEAAKTEFLFDEIDDLIRTAFRFPTERLSRLLGLFETRRLASNQNVTGIIAALAAAALGAIFAFAFSRDQSGQSPATVTVIVRPGATPPTTTVRITTTRTPPATTVRTTTAPTATAKP
jgi:hypothetical protein